MKTKLFIALFAISTIANAQGVWTQKAPFSGIARWGAISFSIGSKGYVGGGYDGSNNFSDFWEFDPSANTWTQRAPIPVARRAAYSFEINNKGYVCLGANSTSVPTLTDLWEYDPTTNSWNAKANFPGTARYGGTGFAIGSKGYVCCGNEGTASGPLSNQLWEYDPSINSWNQKTNFMGNARYGMTHGSFVIGAKAYVGLGGNSSTQFSDFYAYDQTTDSWSQVANYPGAGRGYPFGFGTCYKGYMGTGHGSGIPYSDFWQYDAFINSWTQVASYGGGNRWLMAGFVIDGKAYAGTGYDFTNNYKDWWQYTCGENSISEINFDNYFSVSPNPSIGKFNITCDKFQINNIEIINTSGEKIYSSDVTGRLAVVNLSLQPNGIYFLHVKSDKATAVKKIIINK